MSRGLGKIERKVLAIIEAEDREFSSRDIAAMVYGVEASPEMVADVAAVLRLNDVGGVARVLAASDVSDAQSASVRRALRTLARAGRVHDVGRGESRHRYWVSDRHYCLTMTRRWQEENLAMCLADRDNKVRIMKERSESRPEVVVRGLAMQQVSVTSKPREAFDVTHSEKEAA